MITLRSQQKASGRKAMDAQEREAVAGARDALAQVIADGSHADRSRARRTDASPVAAGGAIAERVALLAILIASGDGND